MLQYSVRSTVCSSDGVLADLHFNDVTHQVIGAAIEVHRSLGPGLLESIYAPLQGLRPRHVYRVDLVVEDVVVVELKCVERLLPVHQAQVLTYVRLLGYPAGLLINFNEARLMDGVKRVLNPAHSSAGGVRQRPASQAAPGGGPTPGLSRASCGRLTWLPSPARTTYNLTKSSTYIYLG